MNLPLSRCARVALLIAGAAMVGAPCRSQCGIVADLTSGTANNTNIGEITSAFGQELYFTFFDSAVSHTRLWKWTESGGAFEVAAGASYRNPESLTPCVTSSGPTVFYRAWEAGKGFELHCSDGTAQGTGMVRDIEPGSGNSLPVDLVASGNKVFFNARTSGFGEELWVSDGTTAGTERLSDFAPGSAHGRPNDIFAFNGKVLFSAYDPAVGRELFVSDGTVQGTLLLADIEVGVTASSPAEFTRLGEFVYFTAQTSTHGLEVWRTNGTAAGTIRITNAFVAPAFGPTELTACGDLLFFHNITGSGYGELYVSDGSVGSAINLGVLATDLACSGSTLFFRGSGVAGYELWISDGTALGTQQLLDMVPNGSGFPSDFIDCGAGVCFVANTAVHGELWFSDGTAAGTSNVCTLDPGGNAGISLMTMCRGRLFMNAYDPNYGRELIGIATPGASTASLGGASAPDYPRLRVAGGAVPILGSSVDLEGFGPAGHAAIVLGGMSGLPSPWLSIPGIIEGAADWVGLLGGTAVTISTQSTTHFTVPFALPNNAALEGHAFHFQTIWVNPTASPFLQASNGLQLALGVSAPH
tara:strand:- start:3028 stop:4782 length:1755 start_codon:yes stop_codon:yes gene_type:complete